MASRSLSREAGGAPPALLSWLAVVVPLGLVLAGAFLAFPRERGHLIGEDRALETATLLLFALAAALAGWLARRGSRRRGWTIGFGLLGLLGALDEISYGQRLLPISFPQLANGATFDSVSDLDRVFTITLERWGIPWLPVLLALLIGAGAAFAWLWPRLRGGGAMAWLLAAFAACLAVSLLVDSHINPPAHFVLLEEYAEFAAALALVFGLGGEILAARPGRDADAVRRSAGESR